MGSYRDISFVFYKWLGVGGEIRVEDKDLVVRVMRWGWSLGNVVSWEVIILVNVYSFYYALGFVLSIL